MVEEGTGEGKRLGGALGCEVLVKEGDTGDTGEVGEGVSGATKRKAGMCAGDTGGAGGALARRGEWVLGCGREKLVVEFSRVAGETEEAVEFERVMAVICCAAGCVGCADLSAWAQGVVQMPFECPQA